MGNKKIKNVENSGQMHVRSSEPLCYTSVSYFQVFQLSVILRGLGYSYEMWLWYYSFFFYYITLLFLFFISLLQLNSC